MRSHEPHPRPLDRALSNPPLLRFVFTVPPALRSPYRNNNQGLFLVLRKSVDFVQWSQASVTKLPRDHFSITPAQILQGSSVEKALKRQFDTAVLLSATARATAPPGPPGPVAAVVGSSDSMVTDLKSMFTGVQRGSSSCPARAEALRPPLLHGLVTSALPCLPPHVSSSASVCVCSALRYRRHCNGFGHGPLSAVAQRSE